jgi:HlyD family secretion protein
MADKEEIALRHAQARLTRTEALAKEKAVPRNDYDEALSQFELASAQKKAAIAQLDRAKAALRVAQIRIDDSKIVAPVRGVVLSKAAEVGQAVTPASLQGAVLFTIAADLAAMELRVDVAEADIGKVACGQQLTLSVEAFPDTLFYGKVKSIRSEPTVDQKSVSYGVIAEIENRRLLLKPNMTAVVLIETARRDGVHAIPFGALTEKDGHCYVTVPGKEGTFDRREVRKGLRGYDGSIEILSGLRDGDTVIVAAEAG